MRWYFTFWDGAMALYVFHIMMARDCGFLLSLLIASIFIVFPILFDFILEEIEKRKEQE